MADGVLHSGDTSDQACLQGTPRVRSRYRVYIPKGIADESVIARVVTGKLLDHLPLDRQKRRFARLDIGIGKTTMVDWLDKLAIDLAPVVQVMKTDMLTGDILYSDDTKIPVVGDEKGEAKRGFFWTRSEGRRWVYSTIATHVGSEPQGLF
ncbi:MAG TPA: transposase [Fibrobacteraceae bacterium]|nr:transposase [Fibrobacteraceae bacterium]